jgi:hypothetical protein
MGTGYWAMVVGYLVEYYRRLKVVNQESYVFLWGILGK